MGTVEKSLYITGDTVQETGNYVCVSGEVRKLQEGVEFPDCPITEQATKWRHVDHEHLTG